jgi:hypothetical protein
MDAAMLTEALASPELLQSVLEHFPSDLIEAELALLPKSQQQRFWELRLRLNQEKQRIEVNHVAHYTNPSKIPGFHKFENLDLVVVLLIPEAHLAICRLPNGTEESFGIGTLRRKD